MDLSETAAARAGQRVAPGGIAVTLDAVTRRAGKCGGCGGGKVILEVATRVAAETLYASDSESRQEGDTVARRIAEVAPGPVARRVDAVLAGGEVGLPGAVVVPEPPARVVPLGPDPGVDHPGVGDVGECASRPEGAAGLAPAGVDSEARAGRRVDAVVHGQMPRLRLRRC